MSKKPIKTNIVGPLMAPIDIPDPAKSQPETGWLPCLNQRCGSLGKPHPNCRCYGTWAHQGPGTTPTYAEGGQVHFCSETRPHQPGCEYYMAEGGAAPAAPFSGDFNLRAQSNEPEDLQHGPVDFDSLPDESHKAPVDFDSMPQETPPQGEAPPQQPIDFDSMPDEKEDFGSGINTGIAELEGFAKSVAGPLAPLAEHHILGVPYENIKAREEQNPIAHGIGRAIGTVGSLFTGFGEAALVSEGAGALAGATSLGFAGKAALKGALEAMTFDGTDSITKSIIGQPGADPSDTVGASLLHAGAAGLLGAGGGLVFSQGSRMLGRAAASSVSKTITEMPLDMFAGAAAAKTGTGFAGYALFRHLLSKPYEKAFGVPIKYANKYVSDAITRAIVEGQEGYIPDAIRYGMSAAMGAQKAAQGVGTVFSAHATPITDWATQKTKHLVKGVVENDGINEDTKDYLKQQSSNNFASGGEVTHAPREEWMAKVMPEHSASMHAARGRVVGYLNSIRPVDNQPKAAFDRPVKNKSQERSYESAVELAANPMSILNHVNDGSLTPEHVKHFNAMYPESHQYLSSLMTKKITEAQTTGKLPPYQKRQAISMFMGADLDSSFSPAAIQTIQSTYASGQPPQQLAKGGGKKSTNSLSKTSNSQMTDDQAREHRLQAQKA